MMNIKKKSTGMLIFKILFALLLGAILGRVFILNEVGIIALRSVITLSDLFSQFLSFFVPIIVLTLVMPGIMDLGGKASKLLIAAILLSFFSFVIMGLLCVFMGYSFVPSIMQGFITKNEVYTVTEYSGFLPQLLTPLFDVVSAIVLAFSFGIAATKVKSVSFKSVVKEIDSCTYSILNNFIIPILPYYIFAILAKLSASGELFANLDNFLLVLLMIFVISNGYTLAVMFTLSKVTGKPFFHMVKSYIPAYLVAFGTRSSKATIPVSLVAAEKIGVSKEVREFAIPLLATTHMLGDMAAQIFGVIAVYYVFTGEMLSLSLIISYVFLLATILIAAPGTPGGVVVTTKPLLTSFLGLPTNISEAFFAFGIANDSFATATNVAGDGMIAIILDMLSKKWAKKANQNENSAVKEEEINNLVYEEQNK